MQMIRRIGYMGLGIAFVGALSGAPVFAEDKPVDDGSKIMITSPKDKDKVSDSFDLKYDLTKGSQAAHTHVFDSSLRVDSFLFRPYPALTFSQHLLFTPRH